MKRVIAIFLWTGFYALAYSWFPIKDPFFWLLYASCLFWQIMYLRREYDVPMGLIPSLCEYDRIKNKRI